ncbi:hypothetical protein DMB66_40830 [Actinoplanes sp. ATCC 53533]|uniref:hypothetical protein n=1 Tax=Actinoplanes sp. ATCC 53533 TaxID=1288362 RepID=UPI000F77FE1B|nr:hypothetical protein [Actinoplanes sp. ATCC 53533]RSM51917.1 hypothetical protein DMB66_40830 [Actinoplanes sp. ATCC 53533]
MGFLDRRAEHSRAAGEDPTRPVPEGRYGTKPGPRPGGRHEPLGEPAPARRPNGDPVGLPGPRPTGRTDLTELLGRTVLEARVQQVCREYGLIPRSGAAVGSGLSRSYLSRDAGVELAADAHGTVTTVFLHFHGDDGFTSFQGEIPGGAGRVPRRTHLREALGHPDEQGDPYHDRFLGDYGPWDRWTLAGFALHAQFAADGERLERITLTLPDRPPHAA